MEWTLEAPKAAASPDWDEVERAVELFTVPGGTYAVQALWSGRWEVVVTPGDFRRAVGRFDDEAGIYFGINPIRGDFVKPDHGGWKNGDVTRRIWFLVDIDAIRPKSTNSTEDEVAATMEVAAAVIDHMAKRGWPEPIIVNSGNGCHLYWRIDLPNDKPSQKMLAAILKRLKTLDTSKAQIDPAVHDAKRIAKLPGTWSRKGPHSAERPHRLCKIIHIPSSVEVVGIELLAREAGGEAEPEETPAPAPDPVEGWTLPVVNETPGNAYAMKALTEEVSKVAGTTSGRNHQLHESALKMGNFVASGLLDEQLVRNTLTAAARACGLGEDGDPIEIERAINNGLAVGMQNPRTAPERPNQPPVAAVATGTEGDDGRIVVVVTEREDVCVREAATALANAKNLYQRAGRLVRIQRDAIPGKNPKIKRAEGTPRIAEVEKAQLRITLTSVVNCVTEKKTRSGDVYYAPCHPPEWLIDGVHTAGRWEGLPALMGVVESPTLRVDGGLLASPGYDDETGLWYEPSIDFPIIPENPTLADARAAVDSLMTVVADFPFADAASGMAWLSALLTVLARPAIDGPTPLFLISANVPGCGKTKLYEVIAYLTTGRVGALATYPKTDEEAQKLILSAVLAGDAAICFDNVQSGSRIGMASLDQALTAGAINGRILGQSKMTGSIPIRTVFVITGNNIETKADCRRRTLPIWLESSEERPEERSGFAIPDLLGYVKAERGRLVMDALTVIRAYVVASRPPQGLKSMDYVAWCGMVRDAINWCTSVDVADSRAPLADSDEDTNDLEVLIDGWERLCLMQSRESLSASEAIGMLNARSNIPAWTSDDEFQELRGLLLDWSSGDKMPSPKVLGRNLQKLKGRVHGGKRLDSRMARGIKHWFVKRV